MNETKMTKPVVIVG